MLESCKIPDANISQSTPWDDTCGIGPILHILSNYWYSGPLLFPNERVKAGQPTIRWCIKKPKTANKINKSLSVSLSRALECSCMDTIKMQLFQLLTASRDALTMGNKGNKRAKICGSSNMDFSKASLKKNLFVADDLAIVVTAHTYIQGFLRFITAEGICFHGSRLQVAL